MPKDNLGPFLETVVSLVGRRADDPELTSFVTETLGKKVPASMTDGNDTKDVVVPKFGLELAFSHDVLHESYPLVQKSKRAFVPYLCAAWLRKKLPDPLPFGLSFGMSDEELEGCLGEPSAKLEMLDALLWERELDPERSVILSIASDEDPCIAVKAARSLSTRHGFPPRPVVGLFIGWAAGHGLLNQETLSEHLALLEEIRGRQTQGSALVDLLPRGLWNTHLVARADLQDFACDYFNNIGSYIISDLVEIFGGRQGPHGHTEPCLDDDDWAAVDKAAARFDERFAAWIES